MFDGKQVLTITNKIKSSDIGGLSKELTDRIGTGNYDTNRTKYNIEFMKRDDNKIIFASHNGNYYYSYFGKLKDMELGDDINFYDNNRLYKFIYSESYVIKKDGYADIYCDPTKKCIVLITCLEENDDAQIVYIGYLSRVEPYENEE